MAYNILLVDDSKTMQAMLKKTLEMTQLDLGDVHIAGNGREALGVLNEHWIDLVITDLNMPEMNGLELIAAMSTKGMLKSLPVIVVSTDGSDDRVRSLKSQGVRDFIRKPFSPEAIESAIQRVLTGGSRE